MIHPTSRPENPEELFNLHHAQLRNVVECIIGVLKHRFQILVVPPEYCMDVQACIPATLACVHNIIRTWDPEDLEDLEDIGADAVPHESDDCGSIADGVPTEEDRRWMSTKRETIKLAMWASYRAELAQRGYLVAI
jgi:hypothetical protein